MLATYFLLLLKHPMCFSLQDFDQTPDDVMTAALSDGVNTSNASIGISLTVFVSYILGVHNI